MDYRELLHSQIEHPPPANAAKDLVRRLANEFELLEHSARPEQFVRVLCAGPFGIRHAVDIQPASVDAIRIVIAETDSQHVIISPVSQCSFMLSLVTPSAGEPREKVIFGFRTPLNET